MIARSTLLLLTLLLVTALAAQAGEDAPLLQGTVTWIYDGDTLEVDPFGKVRLIGIDTPEQKNSSRDHYLIRQGVSAARQRAMSQAAKQFNISEVKGRTVTLNLDQPARDRHGRLLAYVELPDGRVLNRVLIEKGYAVVYRRFSFKLKDDFLAAEALARERKVGLWGEPQ